MIKKGIKMCGYMTGFLYAAFLVCSTIRSSTSGVVKNSSASTSSPIAAANNATAQLSPQEQVAQKISNFFNSIPAVGTTQLTTKAVDFFQKKLGLPDDQLKNITLLYGLLSQLTALQYIQEHSDATGPTLIEQHDAAAAKVTRAQEAGDATKAADHQQKQAAVQNQLAQMIQTEVEPYIVDLAFTSSAWQNYLKFFITSSFDYEVQLLSQVHSSEEKMFIYLPQYETAYYSQAYTSLRVGIETTRLFFIITDQIRKRMLAQTLDWYNLDTNDLYDQAQLFKTSNFYRFAMALHNSSSSSDNVLVKANVLDGDKVSYGFTKYVMYDSATNKLEPVAAMDHILTVSANNDLYLTSLGALLFKQGRTQESLSSSDKKTSSQNSKAIDTLIPTEDFSLLFQETTSGYAPTQLYFELVFNEGAKLLTGSLNYLFIAQNLSDTMQKLYQAQQATVLPEFSSTLQGVYKTQATLQRVYETQPTGFPNVLLYQPEDQLLLEDLHTCIAQSDSLDSVNIMQPEGFFSSIAHAFESAWHHVESAAEIFADKVKNSLWTIVKKAGDFFVHIAKFTADIGQAFYYLTGLNCAFGGSYQGLSNFNKYMSDSVKQLQDGINDLTAIIKSATNVVAEVSNLGAAIVGQVLGAVMQDPQLATDFTGLVDTLVDATMSIVANTLNFFIEGVGQAVKLSYEAVETLTLVVVDTLGGAITGNFSYLKNASLDFLSDIVSGILSLATLVIDSIGIALKALMTSLAYITAIITDLIIDVTGYMAALFTGNWSENAKLRYEIGQHRTLINAIVGTALAIVMMAACPADGPLAMGLLIGGGVLTAGMSALQIVGAVQQDQQGITRTNDQEEFLVNYESYLMSNVRVIAASENKTAAEMFLKYKALEHNKERGLVYYQNYLNSYFNNYYAIRAFNIGSFYNSLTTPDVASSSSSATAANTQNPGVAPGDLGYWYGLKTGVYNLNPAQGLRIYNAATNTFSQEIAVVSTPTDSAGFGLAQAFSTSPAQLSDRYSWLSQKDLHATTAANMSEIHIRWRLLYDIASPVYVGLYLTERYIDVENLNSLYKNFKETQGSFVNSQPQMSAAWANLRAYNQYLADFDQFSKAFVMYKDPYSAGGAATLPTIGLYENRSSSGTWSLLQGGSTSSNTSISYERGVWYHMQASLSSGGGNQSQLSVTCWAETDPSKKLTLTKQVVRAPGPPAVAINAPSSIYQPPADESSQLSSSGQSSSSSTSNASSKIAVKQTASPTSPSTLASQNPVTSTSSSNVSLTLPISAATSSSNNWTVNLPLTPLAHTPPAHWAISMALPKVNPVASTWTIPWASMQLSLTQPSENVVYGGSFGVIASGAAIEYQILSPVVTVQPTAVRTASDTQVVQQFAASGQPLIEQQRELEWYAKQRVNYNPTFGGVVLKTASDAAIKAHCYVYTCEETQLPVNNGIDYVVFVQSSPSNLQNLTASNVGVSITNQPMYIMSLVTGNLYDTHYKLQTTVQNGMTLFKQHLQAAKTAMPPSLFATLTSMVQKYYAKEVGPFTFGNTKLTGSTDAFASGVYLYTGQSLDKEFTGLDYYITANYQPNQSPSLVNQNVLINATGTTPINGLISLVSGNLYLFEQNGKPITSLAVNNVASTSISTTPTISYASPVTSPYTSLLPQALQTAIQAQITKLSNYVAPIQTSSVNSKPKTTPVLPAPPVFINSGSGYSSNSSSSGDSFGGI